MKAVRLALLAVLLASCGALGEPQWPGTYSTTGTWDLGGPLANDRTVGDAVADLLTEQLVETLGIPSLVQDEAEALVDKAVRPAVKAVVDPNAPKELEPGGVVYQALGATLAQIKVESELTLEKGLLPGSLKGKETFAAFSFEREGKTYVLEAKELNEVGVAITAEWKGQETKTNALEIDAHEVEIEFGELVQKIADLVVDVAGQGELKGKVQAAVSCEQIASRISPNGTGLMVKVGDWSGGLSDQQIKDACGKAVPKIEEQVLGLFSKGTTIELGGSATYDAAARQLKSGDDFGGLIGIAPRPVAPRLKASVVATRK
ncbi:MAG: hypothetical protein QM765_45060 [Myxococcales bacterium]